MYLSIGIYVTSGVPGNIFFYILTFREFVEESRLNAEFSGQGEGRKSGSGVQAPVPIKGPLLLFFSFLFLSS